MLLQTQYGKCIWCMRPLNTAEADTDDSPTDEHIFPQSILGVVTMRDCCKCCNSWLGRAVDNMLLADERIVLAAREAGIKPDELLPRLSGSGYDSLNRPVRYTVKRGRFRLEPCFRPQGFGIGLIDGKTFPQDLQNAKAKLRSLIAADQTLQLTPSKIAKEVDTLFEDFLAKGGTAPVYSRKIRQGIRAVPGPGQINVDGTYKPRETERAIAKIAYETAVVLLTPNLFAKVWSGLEQLQALVRQGALGGTAVFAQESKGVAGRWHAANVSVHGDSLQFTVTLFGKETWKLSFNVRERAVPARLDAYEVTLRNEFPVGGAKLGKLIVNGQDA
mgnify:CR=1 FL=1